MDAGVGPGVGLLVTTVQPESGKNAAWVGIARVTVGTGRAFVVEVAAGVGDACA